MLESLALAMISSPSILDCSRLSGLHCQIEFGILDACGSTFSPRDSRMRALRYMASFIMLCSQT